MKGMKIIYITLIITDKLKVINKINVGVSGTRTLEVFSMRKKSFLVLSGDGGFLFRLRNVTIVG
jgi:hypothetical protein